MQFRSVCAVLAALVISTPVLGVDVPADLPPVPTWSVTADFAVAAGYRDNLLLSPVNPQRSPLLRAEVEVMALKVPGGAFDGYGYLDLAETRYLSSDSADHERTFILAGEARWQPVASFKAGWTFQAYHHDQVLDVSVTEVSLSTAQLKVTGLVTGPNLRWTVGPVWLEARFTGRRDSYASDLDGYDEGEGGARLGWNLGAHTELALGAARHRRDHDTRPQFTSGGRPLTGSHLKTTQTDTQLDWTQTFGAEKKIRLVTAAGRQQSRDNGSGYFDYDRDFARTTLVWKTADWQHDVGVEWSRYDFPGQIIGFGLDPEHRKKRDFQASWMLTRKFSDRWSAFLYAEREQSRSNDDRSRYTVQTAYLGVKCSWDNLDSLLPSP